MQTFKDILVYIWVTLLIAVLILAIVATINGWIFTAFFSWMALLAQGFLCLPSDGGYGSYDRDF